MSKSASAENDLGIPGPLRALGQRVSAKLRHLIVAALCFGAALAAIPSAALGAGPPLQWISLGDSYSAGTGLGSVTSGCDQDSYAYSPRAIRDILSSRYSIGHTFVACSGHTTANLWATQLPAVAAGHTVATLTIGGNDIGFEPKLKGCAIGACGPDVMSLKADVPNGSQTWDVVYSNLVTTYVNVRKRMAAGGRLYVLTYPIPFSRQTSSCQGFNAIEQSAANALITRLDDTIFKAVQRANELLPAVHGRPGNVTFIDWREGTRIVGGYVVPAGYSGAGQKFDTYSSSKGLCNTSGLTPLINGYVTSTNYKNSFHPNSTGYWLAATKVSAGVLSAFGNPFGRLDAVSSPGAGRVTVKGWAADPNAPSQSLSIHVYSGTTYLGSLSANLSRPDVATAYPTYGQYHGFSGTLSAPAGNLTVCAFGINVGAGRNAQLTNCRAVTVSSLGAYAGHIVKWSGETPTPVTSWYVTRDLKRLWIPDGGTYNCFKARGAPGPDLLSSTTLNQLPDQRGKWAACGDNMGVNRVLRRGMNLKSSDGRYQWVLQTDGNLVLYGPSGRPIWANGRFTTQFVIMQGDGNMVGYTDAGGVTWATNTAGTGTANRLVIQSDGNAVIYAGSRAVWATNTVGRT